MNPWYIAGGIALLGVLVLLSFTYPDIKRYLKMRSM
jgi:hypothetical protein